MQFTVLSAWPTIDRVWSAYTASFSSATPWDQRENSSVFSLRQTPDLGGKTKFIPFIPFISAFELPPGV
jgi:hypothetical protein